jgi:hypothetical protein
MTNQEIEISIDDVYYDFNKILRHQLLVFDKTSQKFVWKPITCGKIVGSIDTEQRSAPLVIVNICHIVDNKVIYTYSTESYHCVGCTIEWFDADDGKYYTIDTHEDLPYEIVARGIVESTGDLCRQLPQMDKIKVHDSCGMINYHASHVFVKVNEK